MAHRAELLEQAADKIKKSTGLVCAVEKAEQSCLGSWFRIVVGSVQSLTREKRLKQFDKDYFQTIIIDEAHHSISDSYQNVLQYFDEAKILGVTATPDRGDMKNLGQYFNSLAYEYTLPKAIREGFLCKIKAQTIPIKLDLTGVGMQSGDFKAADVSTALDPYLHQIAREMVNYCKGRKTVVFLPLIKTSQKFRDFLNEAGFRAAEVNGQSEDRAEILRDFENDRYDVLCNSMLLTEGWDCPSVDCIIVLRPTKIRSLYAQMVGRGTRLFPGKEELLLLDFLWHTERHDLCRPAHLIATNEEVAQKMTEKIEQSSCPMDIETVEKQASEDVIAAREEALAKKLTEMKSRKRKLVDPLQFEMSIQAEDLSGYTPAFGWEMAPPSDSQIKTLEKLGIFPDEIETAGKATKLLDRLNLRRTEGLTTPKQIRFLESRGFQHVGTWQFDQAKGLIDRVAANGWQIPRGVVPNEYNPGGHSQGGSDLS
jgi:superfamily II DNA or RNA helicase